MKFEDIKQGDTVYVRSEVRVGWSGGESFWLPKKVDKVTPKQFYVGDKRYKKEDGRCIGGGYGEIAAMLGEEISRNDHVVNQTTERNSLVRKLNTAYEIKAAIDQFRIDHKHPRLAEIHKLLKQAEALLVDE